MDYLKDIEKLLGEKIETEILEGFEPVDKFSGKPASKQNQRGGGGNRGGGNRKGGGGGKPSWKKKGNSSSRRTGNR